MAKNNQLADDLADRFWANVKHKIGNEKRNQNVLYHYSGLDSLMGMMETNKIWMSKGTFLNDSNELIYITGVIDLVVNKLEKRIAMKFGTDEKVKKITKLLAENLEKTLNRFESEIDLDVFKVYIFSLTTNKDSLALWYNYAKGDGYNIGFSSQNLLRNMEDFSARITEQYNLVFGEVIYEKAEQEETMMYFLMDTIDYLLKNYSEVHLEQIQKELEDHIFSIITTCSVFFKNEAFKSEEEYRIAFLKKINTANEEKLEVVFRSQNGVVIPFIMVDFDTKLPISEVTIGPKNNIDVAKAGMEHYLKSKGYNVKEINIIKSVAELRY